MRCRAVGTPCRVYTFRVLSLYRDALTTRTRPWTILSLKSEINWVLVGRLGLVENASVDAETVEWR